MCSFSPVAAPSYDTTTAFFPQLAVTFRTVKPSWPLFTVTFHAPLEFVPTGFRELAPSAPEDLPPSAADVRTRDSGFR